MNKSKLLYSIFAIAFGIFLIVFGGINDSPGAQLLGLLLVLIGVVGIVKSKKKAPPVS